MAFPSLYSSVIQKHLVVQFVTFLHKCSEIDKYLIFVSSSSHRTKISWTSSVISRPLDHFRMGSGHRKANLCRQGSCNFLGSVSHQQRLQKMADQYYSSLHSSVLFGKQRIVHPWGTKVGWPKRRRLQSILASSFYKFCLLLPRPRPPPPHQPM